MVQEVLMALSLIIVIASITTIIARIIKQPPIIAYIVAGILAGPLFFNILRVDSSNLIQVFAHIGVAFLLFIVGLNLDLRLLKEVGKVSIFAGISQILITFAAGFLIAMWLGMSILIAIYIGLVLAFSSTIVVVKLLSDKKEIDSLHGRIAIGILIIQDFVAAIALMLIPLINQNGNFSFVFSKLLIVLSIIILIFLFAHFILNRFLVYLARSQETLFLFGIAWALILASIFDFFGFSLEIGALIAGMSLASSKYNLELGGKMKPLRDFFIVLFFVFFGSQLNGMVSYNLLLSAVILSLFILIGKPLIIMLTLKLFGYKKRTNFLTGSSLAQISEFSLILVLLGFTLGHLTQEIMSLVVLIAIITITISSYGIHHSHLIFNKISPFLNFFEGGIPQKTEELKEPYHIFLFGYHRMGYKIFKELQKTKKSIVVVDYNPRVILALSKHKINCIYGDIGDKGFIEDLDFSKAKMVVSTIPDEEANLIIKDKLKEVNKEAVFIATSENPRGALDLYKTGVDYVIVPHHLGGDYAAHLIRKFNTEKKKYKDEGKKHLKELYDAKKNSTF